MNLYLNADFTHLLLTTVLSFLTGLEVRTYREKYHSKSAEDSFFGTARTFTFTGILGFLLYKIDSDNLLIYTMGYISITLLFAIFYYHRLQRNKQSVLMYLVLMCVYTFGPLSLLYPLWMPSLLFVMIVFILNAKESIHRVSLGLNPYELETLGKMILLSAVILPLLPDRDIIPYIPLSPFKIWLAVVVISGISYGGYIAQKYFFPDKGYFLTGIIGGTYSSTATTVVLARKAKNIGKNQILDASIIAATSMMYLRLVAVAAIFNFTIAEKIVLPFAILSLIGFVISLIFIRGGGRDSSSTEITDSNPLELGTAFIFAALFVVMMMLTQYVVKEYGTGGLEILSFIVGFTDIDPFILSLLTGKYSVTVVEIVAAIMIAAGSNNLLKAIYAIWFGGIRRTWRSAVTIALLGVATIGWAFWLERVY